MPAHGNRLRLSRTKMRTAHMIGRPDVLDQANALAAITNDYFWDTTPKPVTIDYTWLIQPVQFRLDPPVNDVSVTDGSGNAARVTSTASITEFGTKVPSAGYQLATAVAADADSLAAHVISNYAVPPPQIQRQRCPQIIIDLLALTSDQQVTVLGIDEGTRIVIANTPATWPAGASSLIVEGKTHDVGVSRRYVTFNTSPVIGTNPGTPGPYFHWGSSTWGSSTDLIPF